MKIDRLLGILMLLLNRKKVTAKELAEHFNVSVRTIQRDIDSLTLAGIPLYADVGKNGGYQLLEYYKMDKNFLNVSESKVLIAFLENLQKMSPHRDIKSLYNKFQTVLPEVTEHQKVVVQLNPLLHTKEMQELLEKLSRAQDEEQKLAINYMNAEFNVSKRVVHPYTLVMLGSAWYLYGFCELREAFRLFKLTRISSCELLSTTYDKQKLPSSLPWEGMIDSDRVSTRVVLKVDKKIQGKLSDYFHPKDCEINEDYIIVKMNFPVDEWVYGLLLSMVPYVQILEPEWVRNEFVNRLGKSLELNKR